MAEPDDDETDDGDEVVDDDITVEFNMLAIYSVELFIDMMVDVGVDDGEDEEEEEGGGID
ncbi:hypothetical protein DERF_014801 [Dermatophagoides farinae]|uniref:Uncharacterized protein n=1 Tax=Dermatophagoides farinae TaxID=6954 RepID=A0A922HN54_DERFA|nr:hypothetical protein DERF_014801 [Dermatophagoides farinae]